MILLEIKILFDKHKDNEKSQSREITSHKFYEVLSYLISPRRIGENKKKHEFILFSFSTKSLSFTYPLIWVREEIFLSPFILFYVCVF